MRSSFVAASSNLALKQPTIRVVAIIAEGVPESDTKELIAYARSNNKARQLLVVFKLEAGAFKIGDSAGTIDNIIQCKLYRLGSGGMSNELYNTISRVTDGIYEGIAIGGDVFPGCTLSDHVLRFNNILQIKMIVVLGELGDRDEYSLVEALKAGKINKPVCAWVSGTCARLFKSVLEEANKFKKTCLQCAVWSMHLTGLTRFGGPPQVLPIRVRAKSGGEMESAQAKLLSMTGIRRAAKDLMRN
ncbi:hypothetical protein L2E82_42478 [Cichorium intybus]|uniref:Uncharacterized protein n=1 Tax=Cichorium intybus TaxID=13427 RepID=A0ACB8ZM05_CICIN|nr:hypothetical protein L2E82_42478 [Cichorium intybus]